MKHRAYVAVDYRLAGADAARLERIFRAVCAGCPWRGSIYAATAAGDDPYGRNTPAAVSALGDAINHRRRR